jgi:two-component system sensor histidine kinase/response regulator
MTIHGKAQGAHIMVVDDDQTSRLATQFFLEKAGARVSHAPTGLEAIRLAKAATCDLILMDVEMPDLDGLDATRALRAIPDTANLRIIGLTSYGFEDDRERCLRAGMNDHLDKPIDEEALGRALAKWLPAK